MRYRRTYVLNDVVSIYNQLLLYAMHTTLGDICIQSVFGANSICAEKNREKMQNSFILNKLEN